MLTVVLLLAIVGAGTVAFGLVWIGLTVRNYIWDIDEMQEHIRVESKRIDVLVDTCSRLSECIGDLQSQIKSIKRGE